MKAEIFSNVKKLTEFISNRSALQKILKEILYVEEKWHLMEIGIFTKEENSLEMLPVRLWFYLVKFWLNLSLNFMFLIYISFKYDYINKCYALYNICKNKTWKQLHRDWENMNGIVFDVRWKTKLTFLSIWMLICSKHHLLKEYQLNYFGSFSDVM